MKRILGILLILLLIVGVGGAWALNPTAGTVTSFSDKSIGQVGGVRLFQVDYTTHSSNGTFTVVTDFWVNGWILSVQTNPGSTAPTANYDIVLNDDNGQDVMGGALADRSATATESTRALRNGNYEAVENHGFLTIQVTNAGNSKTAEILIYYLPF